MLSAWGVSKTCCYAFLGPKVRLSWLRETTLIYDFDKIKWLEILALNVLLAYYRFHERGETTTLTVEKDGLFDVSVNKLLSVDQLKPETVFQCLLTIPGTQYSVREETMYFPGKGKLQYVIL